MFVQNIYTSIQNINALIQSIILFVSKNLINFKIKKYLRLYIIINLGNHFSLINLFSTISLEDISPCVSWERIQKVQWMVVQVSKCKNKQHIK